MIESALYRAVWRWHFIAGLLVIPFLLLLAVTGGLYLFKDELDHAMYRAWDEVPARSAPLLDADALVARVRAATQGEVLQLNVSGEPSRAVRLVVAAQGGLPKMVFADPYDGHVIGSTRYGGIMQLIRKLHSLQFFGPRVSWLIEAAAGWVIVLVASGVYLWWPRGEKGGVLSVRGGAGQRVFWRDTHAVTGICAGAVVLFLAVTGMPWSDLWGGKLQEFATATSTGRPEPPAAVLPDWLLENYVPPPEAERAGQALAGEHPAHHHGDVKPDLPWALEKATPPQSAAPGARQPISIDAALRSIEGARLPAPYSVTLPMGPRGAYAATYSPPRVEDARVVYLDQYDGRVLDDVGFARFGVTAKAIEWGIAVHQGQEYGIVNRYLMLAGCIAIVILAISSITMWWMRRPAGTLGVPAPPANRRVVRGIAAIVIVIGIFYPLVGVSFLVAVGVNLAWDAIARRRAAA
jgi:uncharacterized iron-regulated membrane protein